jgi:tRNA(Ile)-lysidine synthase
MREPRAVGGPVAAGALWDGRWQMSGAVGEVRALGAEGLRACPDWRATGLPREVLLVTPAVWLGDRLIAAPPAGTPGDFDARIARPFHLFGLSH